MAEPGQLPTREVLNEGNKYGPVRVLMLVVFECYGEAREKLNPIETKARDAGRRGGRAALDIFVYIMSVKDNASARGGGGYASINDL
jgi:hypothetical protein